MSEPGRPSPEPRRDAYRLFRNRQQPELICAVPDRSPFPAFIAPGQWAFDKLLCPKDAAPTGFRDRAAAVGVRLNGFHLFQTFLC